MNPIIEFALTVLSVLFLIGIAFGFVYVLIWVYILVRLIIAYLKSDDEE